MKTLMKIFKKILLIILTVIILLIAGTFAVSRYKKYQNQHYWKYAAPEGEIEKKYTALGPYDVSYTEYESDNAACGKYEIWYPTEMNSSVQTYPLVVMANGTGVKASQYQEVFRHLASWGFVVIGNEDENSRTGASSAASLDFILRLDEDQNSVFHGKIDRASIGIAGHSQGGVGAINAVTAQDGGDMYRAIFTASATSGYWGQEHIFGAEWSYDISKIQIPYLMVAGTGGFDAGTAEDITASEGQGICPLWSLSANYHEISDSVCKVMARAVDKDHGDMLRHADGYMTAWFLYWLKGDADAGTAFFGEDAEILTNPGWQDVKVNSPSVS